MKAADTSSAARNTCRWANPRAAHRPRCGPDRWRGTRSPGAGAARGRPASGRAVLPRRRTGSTRRSCTVDARSWPWQPCWSMSRPKHSMSGRPAWNSCRPVLLTPGRVHPQIQGVRVASQAVVAGEELGRRGPLAGSEQRVHRHHDVDRRDSGGHDDLQGSGQKPGGLGASSLQQVDAEAEARTRPPDRHRCATRNRRFGATSRAGRRNLKRVNMRGWWLGPADS